MSDFDTLSPDERLSRYLSIEWAVAEESAVKLSAFAKDLNAALASVTKSLDEAHKEGDLLSFSAMLTVLNGVLDACEGKRERVAYEAYGHYVELLGSREEVHRMAAALLDFIEPEGEPEPDGFADLLASVGGDGKMV